MRSSWKTLVAVAAALIAVPLYAAADDVQEQLNQMQARMAQLEDSLTATQDELNSAQTRVEEQEAVLARATDDREAVSALSSFLNETEFGGTVAASYNYNFEDPLGGGNMVTPPIGTHNSFQYDQLHFSMANVATEKSRAGFGVDLLQGASVGGDTPVVNQAYASYLMPIGNGVELKAGRWDTPIGAEVVYVGENTNITRGLVWGIQPVNHNGVLLTANLSDSLSLHGGVANSGFTGGTLADVNNAKAWIAGGAWDGGSAGLSATYMAFDDAGNATADRGHMIDFVATWDPSDNLSIWANFDWVRNASAFPGDMTNAAFKDGDSLYGVALATRLGVTDKTGVGVRGEWVGSRPDTTGALDEDVFSLTGTLDHALTDNLTARAEIRWDHASDATPFASDVAAGAEDNQILAIGQLVYAF